MHGKKLWMWRTAMTQWVMFLSGQKYVEDMTLSETHCILTQMALHARTLVLLKLCNSITEQRDDHLLRTKPTHTTTRRWTTFQMKIAQWTEEQLKYIYWLKYIYMCENKSAMMRDKSWLNVSSGIMSLLSCRSFRKTKGGKCEYLKRLTECSTSLSFNWRERMPCFSFSASGGSIPAKTVDWNTE